MQAYLKREGYTQIAWAKSPNPSDNDDVYILSTSVLPEEDMILYAVWTESKNGDILLNTLEGDFEDGTFYKKYSNGQVKLPSRLVYEDKNTRLAAWCDSTIPYTLGTSEENLYICEGKDTSVVKL